jgi:hypothetical protein
MRLEAQVLELSAMLEAAEEALSAVVAGERDTCLCGQ